MYKPTLLLPEGPEGCFCQASSMAESNSFPNDVQQSIAHCKEIHQGKSDTRCYRENLGSNISCLLASGFWMHYRMVIVDNGLCLIFRDIRATTEDLERERTNLLGIEQLTVTLH